MAESSEKMPPYHNIFTFDFQMSDQVKYDIKSWVFVHHIKCQEMARTQEHELPQTPCRKAASSRRDPLSDLSTHHFGLATALLCHNRRCYTLIQKGNPGTPWISLNRDLFNFIVFN